MRTPFSALTLCILLAGCGTAAHKEAPQREISHRPQAPVVDIAVNLGLQHEGDLRKLYHALASTGLPCGLRAMSLDAEQIVVERADFDRAKITITNAIFRDRLTVRVYESPDFDKFPSSSLLEVWENGHKIREEEYKLYLSPYTGQLPHEVGKN
jgi:hypothetical protein